MSTHRKSGWGSLLIAVLCSTSASAIEVQKSAWLADNIDTQDYNVELCSACDTCCGDSCDCGSACCWENDRLLKFIRRSDHCFDCFISPMTNPTMFEDPRTLTEARLIFLNHRVPSAAGGGETRLIAAQFRAALTERLSITAVKDGFIMSTNDLINDGWADVGAGLKYNLYADPQSQRLLSTGFNYEMPVGTPRAFQGNGDGEYHFYLSGGTQIGDRSHWISNMGVKVAANDGEDSDIWYWSNHLDYQVRQGWYLLTELNWFTWIGAGANTALPGVEGGDLFNFGSVGVAGNDIVTNAYGIKYKRDRFHEFGVAFEFPVTDREDVLANRLTVDWIFRY